MTFGMVFPGQGSQSVGMLAGFGDAPEVREVLARASAALGQDIGRLIAEGPAEELGKTVNTQPVMVTAGYAAYRVWESLGGPEPDVVAGHSLGEYTALVVAGAMAAILGLDDDGVRAACTEVAQGEVVEAVNFNAPGQVVIAGHAAAVQRAMEACKARGAKRAVALPVSAPFHSSLLAPAAARLRERLAGVNLQPPRIPVVHNVDVSVHTTTEGIRDALVRQADHPVRWVECIQAMAARGATLVCECGPGKVLAPLVKRTVEGAEGRALVDRAAIEQAIATLEGA